MSVCRASARSLSVVLGAVALTMFLLRLALAGLPVEAFPWPVAVNGWQDGPACSTSVPDAPWALVVGGSTANAAFDRDALGRPSRKSVVPVGRPSDVLFTVDWLLRVLPPDRRPAVVVWGATRGSFVPADEYGAACLSRLATAWSTEELERRLLLSGGYVSRDLTLRDRLLRAYVAVDPWFGAREGVRAAVVVHGRGLLFGGEGTLPPSPQLVLRGERPAHRRRRIDAWRERGTFRPGTLDAVSATAVAATAERCRLSGVPLVVVGLPEHSATRALYDPRAISEFRGLFEHDDILWIDLFDSLPDSAFSDHAHVNLQGRRRVTDRVAGVLERLPVPPR